MGSKIVQQVKLGFGTMEGYFEIVGYEPGVETVYRSDSPFFTGDNTFRVEPAGEGTRLGVPYRKGGIWPSHRQGDRSGTP